MAEISSRELRNQTSQVLRRVEAGKRLRVSVNRRPVAELVPLGRAIWAPGSSIERVLRGATGDAGLLKDLGPIRKQVIEPR